MWQILYIYIFTLKTNSLVNSFIYMAISFDPKIGSSSGRNTKNGNVHRNQNLQLMLLVSVYVSSFVLWPDDDLSLGPTLVAI